MLRPEALALLSAFLMALSEVGSKHALSTVSPSAFLVIRWVSASLMFTALLAVSGQPPDLTPNVWLFTLLLACVLGPILAWNLYMHALSHLDLSVANPLRNGQLFVTAFFAFVILGERPSIWAILGSVAIVVGLGLLQGGHGSSRVSFRSKWVLMGLGASVAWGFNNVLWKLIAGHYSVLDGNWMRNTVPALLMLGSATVRNQELRHWPVRPTKVLPPLSIGWAYAFAAALLTDVLAWILRFAALRGGDASVITPLAATNPLFVAVMAALIFRDAVTPKQVAGIATCMAGVILLSI
ncbi:MAG: DMT family transporter [Chloroflexi bacterium]|nr:DMT family transporter [Chloroflexota bacterium]